MKKEQIIRELSKPVPKKYLSVKQGSQYYIAWFDVAELMDEIVGLGNWTWEVLSIYFETTAKKSRCYLVGKLTILADDGTISMTSTGQEVLNCPNYGDPSSNAEAMAMRRCASKFGLGRDLYRKEELEKIKKGTYGEEETAQAKAKLPEKTYTTTAQKVANSNGGMGIKKFPPHVKVYGTPPQR